jgi:hypothetical protein
MRNNDVLGCGFVLAMVIIPIAILINSSLEPLGIRVRIYPADFPETLKSYYAHKPKNFGKYNEWGIYHQIPIFDETGRRLGYEDSFYYCGPLVIERIEYIVVTTGNRHSVGSMYQTLIITDRGVFNIHGFQKPEDGIYLVSSGFWDTGHGVDLGFNIKQLAQKVDFCPSVPKPINTQLIYFWQK